MNCNRHTAKKRLKLTNTCSFRSMIFASKLLNNRFDSVDQNSYTRGVGRYFDSGSKFFEYYFGFEDLKRRIRLCVGYCTNFHESVRIVSRIFYLQLFLFTSTGLPAPKLAFAPFKRTGVMLCVRCVWAYSTIFRGKMVFGRRRIGLGCVVECRRSLP